MKRFFKEYFLENWTLKATALLLALILWLFVRGEPGPERVVAVPLEVRISQQMEITNERPTSVEVTMRGAPFSNMWFGKALPSCIVDLQDAAEGENIVALTPDNIKISKGSGIRVLQVNPARISILLEKIISKEVPIVAPILQSPPQGFEVYNKILKPSSIIIYGPRTRVAAVQSIHTNPISLNGQKQSTRFYESLNITDHMVRTSMNNSVQVEILIGPHRKVFTIPKIPVLLDSADYEITPKQIAIQVLAPPNMIDKISAANFSATVSIKTIDVSMLPAKIVPTVRILDDLNGAISIKDLQPAEVVVRQKN